MCYGEVEWMEKRAKIDGKGVRKTTGLVPSGLLGELFKAALTWIKRGTCSFCGRFTSSKVTINREVGQDKGITKSSWNNHGGFTSVALLLFIDTIRQPHFSRLRIKLRKNPHKYFLMIKSMTISVVRLITFNKSTKTYNRVGVFFVCFTAPLCYILIIFLYIYNMHHIGIFTFVKVSALKINDENANLLCICIWDRLQPSSKVSKSFSDKNRAMWSFHGSFWDWL